MPCTCQCFIRTLPSARRFIKWSQGNANTGSRRTELLPLLERCTRELQAAEQYRGDVRYLRVWIQYVRVGPQQACGACTTCMWYQALQCSSRQPCATADLLCDLAVQADCLPDPRDVFAFLKVPTVQCTRPEQSTPAHVPPASLQQTRPAH